MRARPPAIEMRIIAMLCVHVPRLTIDKVLVSNVFFDKQIVDRRGGLSVERRRDDFYRESRYARNPLNVANDGRELERLHSAQSLVEECADVAVLLARNAYITGRTISVNGGMYFAASPSSGTRPRRAARRIRTTGAGE